MTRAPRVAHTIGGRLYRTRHVRAATSWRIMPVVSSPGGAEGDRASGARADPPVPSARRRGRAPANGCTGSSCCDAMRCTLPARCAQAVGGGAAVGRGPAERVGSGDQRRAARRPQLAGTAGSARTRGASYPCAMSAPGPTKTYRGSSGRTMFLGGRPPRWQWCQAPKRGAWHHFARRFVRRRGVLVLVVLVFPQKEERYLRRPFGKSLGLRDPGIVIAGPRAPATCTSPRDRER